MSDERDERDALQQRLAADVNALRKSMGLTLRQLGKTLGCPPNNLSKYFGARGRTLIPEKAGEALLREMPKLEEQYGPRLRAFWKGPRRPAVATTVVHGSGRKSDWIIRLLGPRRGLRTADGVHGRVTPANSRQLFERLRAVKEGRAHLEGAHVRILGFSGDTLKDGLDGIAGTLESESGRLDRISILLRSPDSPWLVGSNRADREALIKQALGSIDALRSMVQKAAEVHKLPPKPEIDVHFYPFEPSLRGLSITPREKGNDADDAIVFLSFYSDYSAVARPSVMHYGWRGGGVDGLLLDNATYTHDGDGERRFVRAFNLYCDMLVNYTAVHGVLVLDVDDGVLGTSVDAKRIVELARRRFHLAIVTELADAQCETCMRKLDLDRRDFYAVVTSDDVGFNVPKLSAEYFWVLAKKLPRRVFDIRELVLVHAKEKPPPFPTDRGDRIGLASVSVEAPGGLIAFLVDLGATPVRLFTGIRGRGYDEKIQAVGAQEDSHEPPYIRPTTKS